MNTVSFDHVSEVRSARLVPGEAGKYYIHVVLELHPDLPLETDGRMRLHLTDGVNHEYTELLPVENLHQVAVELEPTVALPSVSSKKKKQFKDIAEEGA